MRRWIGMCAIVMLVQLGLTVASHLAHRGGETTAAKGPLLALQGAAINGLRLEDGEGHTLEISKVQEKWLLPGAGNFPADAARVQGLIEKLTNLQRGWPEATTAEAATRFKVAPTGFAHRLTLLQEGKPAAVVYFGTSPGLRKLYLRVDKDAEIHALALSAQDLATKVESWIDTTVLHLKPEQIVRVHLPGVELERGQNGLQPMGGLHEGEQLNKERLDALINRLTRLSITNILGTELKPEYGLETPSLQYTIEIEGGTTISYTFGQPPKPSKAEGKPEENRPAPDGNGDRRALRVSDQEQVLQVDGWQVDELNTATRAALIKPATAAATPGQAAGALPSALPLPPAGQ